MAEIITLTTPLTKPSQTTITIERITFDRVAQSVYVQWSGNNGEAASYAYVTPAPIGATVTRTGASLLSLVNTRNFTTNSMMKQILQLIQTDGLIGAGSVSGTPD